MSVQDVISDKLQRAFTLKHLEVVNESHGHNVRPGSETHFKVTVVSDHFAGMRAVQRHQLLYKLLNDELQNGVHALAMHLYTVDEWQQIKVAPDSPACMGGAKK